MRRLRSAALALTLGGAMTAGCESPVEGPGDDLAPPLLVSTNAARDTDLFEDRLQHARYYPELAVIRQCQANPLEDADGNDWTRTGKGGDTRSHLVEPDGVVLVREFTVLPSDLNADGQLITPSYFNPRWVPVFVGRGHITINLRRDASGYPTALITSVRGIVSPLGPDDSWIGLLNEPDDELPGAHDLRNEAFTPGATILALIDARVEEALRQGTLHDLACDTHIWYEGGVPSWIQRNEVLVAAQGRGRGRGG